MVAAGEGGTAANGQHKVIGARLGWASKSFGVSAATTHTENNLTTSGKFKDHAIGGQADFGVVRLSAAYRVFEQAASEQTNILLGVTVPVGQGELKLSWNRADLDGRVGTTSIAANDAQQWGVGYVYWLSKRSSAVRNDGPHRQQGCGHLRDSGRLDDRSRWQVHRRRSRHAPLVLNRPTTPQHRRRRWTT